MLNRLLSGDLPRSRILALMLLLIRVLSRAVVRPLLRLAQASRSIAEGDLSSPDLPVKSSDEVGRLTGTFNQMKHAMAQQLTTQQALHRRHIFTVCQNGLQRFFQMNHLTANRAVFNIKALA